MGGCMSSNKDEEDQKKRSQAIDRVLDEDSKRLRRECKILLLGKETPTGHEWLAGPPFRIRVSNSRMFQGPARAASRRL